MNFWSIFILVYVISVIGSWSTTRLFLVKAGYKTAEVSDVFFVIAPIVNIFSMVYYLQELLEDVDAGWFFKLKKVK